ncbi:unnamed protein product [Allacma fusca]|uniref:Uncharacterized protein n=1 Tax=Allacma fusca TaxID=39272 RepID=A0A8J2K079_9HEXA|nr:unnamed protein product [Allacma fusca]
MEAIRVNIITCSSCNKSLGQGPDQDRTNTKLKLTSCRHIYHEKCLTNLYMAYAPGTEKCVFSNCNTSLILASDVEIQANNIQITTVKDDSTSPATLVEQLWKLRKENQELKIENNDYMNEVAKLNSDVEHLNDRVKASVEKIIYLKKCEPIDNVTPEHKYDNPIDEFIQPLSDEEQNPAESTSNEKEIDESQFEPKYEDTSDEDTNWKHEHLQKEKTDEFKIPLVKSTITKTATLPAKSSPKKSPPKKLSSPTKTSKTMIQIRRKSPERKPINTKNLKVILKPSGSRYVPRTPLRNTHRRNAINRYRTKYEQNKFESIIDNNQTRSPLKPGHFGAIRDVKNYRNRLTISTYDKKEQVVHLPVTRKIFQEEIRRMTLKTSIPDEFGSTCRKFRYNLYTTGATLTLRNKGTETIFFLQQYWMLGDGLVHQMVHFAIAGDQAYTEKLEYNDYVIKIFMKTPTKKN